MCLKTKETGSRCAQPRGSGPAGGPHLADKKLALPDNSVHTGSFSQASREQACRVKFNRERRHQRGGASE